MGKSTIAFEWQELREDQELPSIPEISVRLPAANPGRKRSRLIMLGGALCFLLAALLGATWVERQAEAGLAVIEEELALAVDGEVWDARQAAMSAAGLHDAAGSGQNREKVVSTEVQALRRDVAAVMVISEVNLAGADPATVYRQLRFYRQTEAGWQPTEPIPSLWGQSQHLATDSFDITYRSRDAQAVQAVAEDLDALYAEIRDNLGLLPALDGKITIEVVMEPATNSGNAPHMRATHMVVASPVLAPAPVSLPHAVILRQAILARLVDIVIEEAAHAHMISLRWHPLLSAMRRWQLTDLAGAPATGHQAARYKDVLDRFHVDAGIVEVDSIRLPSYRFLIAPPYDPYGGQLRAEFEQEQHELVIGVAMLDYVAATYGREQISALWPALREHQHWDTLIPALFGVPVDAFEADWRAYPAEAGSRASP